MRPHGGFVPGPDSRPLMMCRDSSTLSAFVGRRATGEGYVRLSYSAGGEATRFGPCDPNAGMRMAAPLDDFPELPMLNAPPGATTIGGGSMGGGPDARDLSTRLETSLAPAAIAAHYATQLRDAGWTLASRIVNDGVATQTAHRAATSASGSADTAPPRPWHAVLLVTVIPGTREHDVVLHIARPTRPR